MSLIDRRWIVSYPEEDVDRQPDFIAAFATEHLEIARSVQCAICGTAETQGRVAMVYVGDSERMDESFDCLLSICNDCAADLDKRQLAELGDELMKRSTPRTISLQRRCGPSHFKNHIKGKAVCVTSTPPRSLAIWLRPYRPLTTAHSGCPHQQIRGETFAVLSFSFIVENLKSDIPDLAVDLAECLCYTRHLLCGLCRSTSCRGAYALVGIEPNRPKDRAIELWGLCGNCEPALRPMDVPRNAGRRSTQLLLRFGAAIRNRLRF